MVSVNALDGSQTRLDILLERVGVTVKRLVVRILVGVEEDVGGMTGILVARAAVWRQVPYILTY